MRLVISKQSLRWMQFLLLACAVFAFGYCGFVLLDSWMFQQQEGQQLDVLLANKDAGPALPGGAMGRMEIKRLGISVVVVEGTSTSKLRHAAGHITGTALPGHAGNAGISAHRDTFFRPLRNVKSSDLITFTTPQGEYNYRVVSTQIVRPEDVSVLKASDHEVLTLVTCYPFYFIGSAPDRFIVRADRIPGTVSKNKLLDRTL